MAGYKEPRASPPVTPREVLPAPTAAPYCRVVLAGESELFASPPMLRSVFGDRRNNLKILRAVIGLVPVSVMHDFFFVEHSPKRFRRHKAMLIDVSTHIGHWMTSALDQIIPG